VPADGFEGLAEIRALTDVTVHVPGEPAED
jgi:hypothetical protein